LLFNCPLLKGLLHKKKEEKLYFSWPNCCRFSLSIVPLFVAFFREMFSRLADIPYCLQCTNCPLFRQAAAADLTGQAFLPCRRRSLSLPFLSSNGAFAQVS
jgi:hypothetical protein